jgi:hypothetical protein
LGNVARSATTGTDLPIGDVVSPNQSFLICCILLT